MLRMNEATIAKRAIMLDITYGFIGNQVSALLMLERFIIHNFLIGEAGVVWASIVIVVYHCDYYIIMSTNVMILTPYSSHGKASIGIQGIVVGKLSATDIV